VLPQNIHPRRLALTPDILEAAAQDHAKWKQFVGGLYSTSGAIKS